MTPPEALLWSYLSGSLAYLVLAAVALLVLSGLAGQEAHRAAMLFPAVLAVTALAYVAVGFAFEFGGVGLLDPRHGFSPLVWEWSPLPETWGIYWGAAGFAGWFLWGDTGTPDAVALLFGHLPWAAVAAFTAGVVARRRAPTLMPLLLGLLIGSVGEPLAGNWVHGGGWLGRLGWSLGLGAGFVDFGGSGVVGLVGGGVGLATLLIVGRRPADEPSGELPPMPWPALAALGGVLLVVGGAGWALHNPLHDLGALPLHRVLVNGLLGFAGGAALPTFYVWLVAGRWHPHLTLMGGYAGWLATLAGLPFLAPPMALLLGVVAGLLFPPALYAVREVARLDDPAGVVTASLLGGTLGVLAVGVFADGGYALPWQPPNVSVLGLWAGGVWRPEAMAQMYAQLIGWAALLVWGFLLGTVTGVALAGLDAALRLALRPAEAEAPVTNVSPVADGEEVSEAT